jgi:hypothetical protein
MTYDSLIQTVADIAWRRISGQALLRSADRSGRAA